jgi:uncharacterized protein YhfF
MTTTEKIDKIWNDYLLTLPENERHQTYFEAASWGNSAELADQISSLIVSGVKTTTSSLLWSQQQENWTVEKPGDKSIVLDSQGNPVCIIETTEVFVQAFNKVSADFVYHYGEGDRTMNFWNKNMWDYYAEECKGLGLMAEKQMPMIYHVFKVIYKG